MDNLEIIDEKSETSSTSNDELDIENQDNEKDGFTHVNYESDVKDDTKDNVAYDPEFARMNKMISSTRTKTNRFDRVSIGNKFNIEMTDTIENEEEQCQDDDNAEHNMTYLDSLVYDLYEDKINEETILKLVDYLKNQKYDTEAMDLDLQINQGNISKHMGLNKECMNAVIAKFNKSRSMSYYLLIYEQDTTIFFCFDHTQSL